MKLTKKGNFTASNFSNVLPEESYFDKLDILSKFLVYIQILLTRGCQNLQVCMKGDKVFRCITLHSRTLPFCRAYLVTVPLPQPPVLP